MVCKDDATMIQTRGAELLSHFVKRSGALLNLSAWHTTDCHDVMQFAKPREDPCHNSSSYYAYLGSRQ